ncbi:hypothetical protein MTO96_017311 [Rhipicephalus appendiculatus]
MGKLYKNYRVTDEARIFSSCRIHESHKRKSPSNISAQFRDRDRSDARRIDYIRSNASLQRIACACPITMRVASEATEERRF